MNDLKPPPILTAPTSISIQKSNVPWKYVIKSDGHVYAPRPLAYQSFSHKTIQEEKIVHEAAPYTPDIGLYYETDLEIFAEELCRKGPEGPYGPEGRRSSRGK